MEITQLERENKFLKKKITELTAQLNGEKQPSRKSRASGKGIVKEDIDPVHLTVQFFFKEINGLLTSLIDLFKVEISEEETEEFEKLYPENEQMEPHKKYTVFKKFALSRKLQKIPLESEEKRYPLLIDLFAEFYKTKE